MRRTILALTLLCISALRVCALESAAPDTLTTSGVYARRGPIGWLARYLRSTNKPTDKAFDMSVVLGPSYNSVTSLTLGGVAAGVYSWDRADSTLQKSNVSMFGALSVTGMAQLGVEGKNFLPHDRWRVNYLLSVMHMPMHLWGVGYDAGDQNDNYGDYSRVYVAFKPEILCRFANNLFVGPMADIDYTYTYDMASKPDGTMPTDFDGGALPSEVFTAGAGLSINYDSRDVVINASSGSLLRIQQLWYPHAFGNSGAFGSTDVTASTYRRVWSTGVLAFDAHGLLTYGEVPWTRLAQMGGAYRMRGYYIGQYRDENLAECQLELRQRIHGRHGCVVWVGCGNVWGRQKFQLRHTLPNFGTGYRWELKKNSNIRIDCGFTKRDWNICFNINEAF